jgi:hypothetical protein
MVGKEFAWEISFGCYVRFNPAIHYYNTHLYQRDVILCSNEQTVIATVGAHRTHTVATSPNSNDVSSDIRGPVLLLMVGSGNILILAMRWTSLMIQGILYFMLVPME